MRAYFHTLDLSEGDDNKTIQMITEIIKSYRELQAQSKNEDAAGKKIIIALPYAPSSFSLQEKQILAFKKLVINDKDRIGYNILGQEVPDKGKPGKPDALEEPSMVGVVLGKGSVRDPNSLSERNIVIPESIPFR